MKKIFILLALAICFISGDAYSKNYNDNGPQEIPVEKDKPGKGSRAPQVRGDVALSYDGTYLYIYFSKPQGTAEVLLTTSEMEYEFIISTEESISLLVGTVEDGSVVTINTQSGNTYIGYF